MNRGDDGRFSKAPEAVKRFWHIYLLSKNPEEIETLIKRLREDLVVIGTGRHEIYQSLEAFNHGLTKEQAELDALDFEIIDEWYEVQPISNDVCVVYGAIWIREKESVGKTVFIEVESRFSVVCRLTESGFLVCNIHQSIPHIDQADGEFYPKTISLLAEEALEKNRKLERRIELDPMTELLNRISIEKRVSQALCKQDGTFLIFDLDDFKSINDSLGHFTGDQVICAFTQLLRDIAEPDVILGRMGGDEFAAWIGGDSDILRTEQLSSTLLSRCGEIGRAFGLDFNCSIGMYHADADTVDFNTLYRQADLALYRAKREGKGTARWI